MGYTSPYPAEYLALAGDDGMQVRAVLPAQHALASAQQGGYASPGGDLWEWEGARGRQEGGHEVRCGNTRRWLLLLWLLLLLTDEELAGEAAHPPYDRRDEHALPHQLVRSVVLGVCSRHGCGCCGCRSRCCGCDERGAARRGGIPTLLLLLLLFVK